MTFPLVVIFLATTIVSTVTTPLVVIPPMDRIPLVVATTPLFTTVPLVVIPLSDTIPFDPYAVMAPLVEIAPRDTIPLIVAIMDPAT